MPLVIGGWKYPGAWSLIALRLQVERTNPGAITQPLPENFEGVKCMWNPQGISSVEVIQTQEVVKVKGRPFPCTGPNVVVALCAFHGFRDTPTPAPPPTTSAPGHTA